MPDLNEKFHFKSIATLSNDLPSAIKQKQMTNNMNLLKIQANGLEMPQDVEDQQNREQMNVQIKKNERQSSDVRNKNTRSILKECGLVNDKNLNVKVLMKGQGISSSMIDVSIDEIYKMIDQSKH